MGIFSDIKRVFKLGTGAFKPQGPVAPSMGFRRADVQKFRQAGNLLSTGSQTDLQSLMPTVKTGLSESAAQTKTQTSRYGQSILTGETKEGLASMLEVFKKRQKEVGTLQGRRLNLLVGQ
jgi:hypothetical protein